jgi:hypothetical protein
MSIINMSKKRYYNTSTKKRQTDQSPWQPKAYLTFKLRLQNCTKAIAKRLETVLPLVINADQTGYIKGRYIGENVRLISDIISYTAAKNLPGLAVFLDFEKAFDSIEWNFPFKTPFTRAKKSAQHAKFLAPC